MQDWPGKQSPLVVRGKVAALSSVVSILHKSRTQKKMKEGKKEDNNNNKIGIRESHGINLIIS